MIQNNGGGGKPEGSPQSCRLIEVYSPLKYREPCDSSERNRAAWLMSCSFAHVSYSQRAYTPLLRWCATITGRGGRK